MFYHCGDTDGDGYDDEKSRNLSSKWHTDLHISLADPAVDTAVCSHRITRTSLFCSSPATFSIQGLAAGKDKAVPKKATRNSRGDQRKQKK